jgi:transposase
MPAPLVITLTAEQRRELEALRDQSEKPYLRERAAAILKVAQGMTARQVARQGLLKPRHPDTVYAWIHRWQNQGRAGLVIQAGRGRKPAFSPCADDG